MSASQANDSMRKAIRDIDPNIKVSSYPLADGGDGILDAMLNLHNGSLCEITVENALGKEHLCNYGKLKDGTVIIEMALVCGLSQLSIEERNPLLTTTYGIGQIILHELKNGLKKFFIGIGGSATNDGGTGMLQALGFQLEGIYNEKACGGNLEKIHAINSDHVPPELKEAQFQIACDVNNPLLGPDGATYTFGPQKGAKEDMLKHLELGMSKYSKAVSESMQSNYTEYPGAGAAGGIGFAFISCLSGQLIPGAELILDSIQFDQQIKGADLIITTEGCLDEQTVHGKLPAIVAQKAKQKNIPTLALCGILKPGWQSLKSLGVYAFAIAQGPISLEASIQKAEHLLEESCREAVGLFISAKST